ncbi:hypothetical protein B0T17DRAFT_497313, partial [Bombardia bombarda]
SAMSRLSPVDRPLSRVSLTPSNRTYHSFHDSEHREPGAAPASRPPTTPLSKDYDRPPTVQEMRRQDSGYESMARPNSQSSRRRTSTASVTSSTHRRRPRPAAQRSPKSGSVSYLPRHSISPHRVYRTQQSHQPQQPVTTYFHFPSFTASEPTLDETEMVTNTHSNYASGSSCYPPTTSEQSPSYPLPPQTTHYWTSDRTRKLEYAAIDAASRGVRGWVRRHIVPDCFIPKEKRRIGFEDDRGSVVRYRLDLDDDGGPEKSNDGSKDERAAAKSWWFSFRARY